MSCKKTISRFLCLILALLLVVVATACDKPQREDEVPDIPTEETDRYEKLDVIDAIFRDKTLFELDDEAIINAILKGYVEGTGDAYAEYFTAEEYAQRNSENRGEMVGIGIDVIENTELGCVEIINVLPESPALEAGLLPGDLITCVGIGEGRQLISELGFSKAIDLMRGEAGSLAEITVDRNGEELEFSIVRRKVISASVTWRVCETDSTVGIVKITGFDFTTPEQFDMGVEALISKGCDKFVFDVRYNPGGDLRSVQYVLSCFLKSGDVFIRTKDRSGNEESRVVEPVSYTGSYEALNVALEDIGKYSNLNIAVITNGSTASAAELFTGTLRDYGLSVTVGEKTFGKGTMQTVFSLSKYGYGGAIKLTTEYYYPPISESYEGIGIYPDVYVAPHESLEGKNIYKITDEEDNQLQAAIKELYNK